MSFKKWLADNVCTCRLAIFSALLFEYSVFACMIALRNDFVFLSEQILVCSIHRIQKAANEGHFFRNSLCQD